MLPTPTGLAHPRLQPSSPVMATLRSMLLAPIPITSPHGFCTKIPFRLCKLACTVSMFCDREVLVGGLCWLGSFCRPFAMQVQPLHNTMTAIPHILCIVPAVYVALSKQQSAIVLVLLVSIRPLILQSGPLVAALVATSVCPKVLDAQPSVSCRCTACTFHKRFSNMADELCV